MSGPNDFDPESLTSKFKWLVDQYEHARLNETEDSSNIKWDADLSWHRAHGVMKEKVIELLTRVTRVSIETMKIVAAMNARSGLR